MLTDYELEKLVMLIDSGQNTFADIHKAFPVMGNNDWYFYIRDAFRIMPGLSGFGSETPKVLRFHHVPDDYSPDYRFKDTDAFTLDIAGKNILYRVKKEHAMEQRLIRLDTIEAQRYVEEMKLNRQIKNLAILGLLIGIIVPIAIAYITSK